MHYYKIFLLILLIYILISSFYFLLFYFIFLQIPNNIIIILHFLRLMFNLYVTADCHSSHIVLSALNNYNTVACGSLLSIH